MIKPPVVRPGEETTVVGQVFDAPLVVKGKTWLPLTQVVTWGLLTRWLGKRSPGRSRRSNILSGGMSMVVLLGSEWCHNLAHAAAAKSVGHPADAIRITWGMPLLVYHEINDAQVTPRHHIVRALGGPVFNALLLPLVWLARRFFRPGTVGHDAADTAVGTNAVLVAAGLSPIPWVDGGPVLKWSLVERGCTVAQADETVRKVNWGYAAAAAGVSAVAFNRKKRLAGWMAALLAGTALITASGLLKETE